MSGVPQGSILGDPIVQHSTYFYVTYLWNMEIVVTLTMQMTPLPCCCKQYCRSTRESHKYHTEAHYLVC